MKIDSWLGKSMKIEDPGLEGFTTVRGLWQPVATFWTPLNIDFSEFGDILSCWMMNARFMEAEQGLGGC